MNNILHHVLIILKVFINVVISKISITADGLMFFSLHIDLTKIRKVL